MYLTFMLLGAISIFVLLSTLSLLYIDADLGVKRPKTFAGVMGIAAICATVFFALAANQQDYKKTQYRIVVDKGTGCQYIVFNGSNLGTIRKDRYNKPICKKRN